MLKRSFLTAIMLSCALLAVAVHTAKATPIIDYFSFSNTDPYGVNGTVTGELKFAHSGVNVAAEAIYILDIPPGTSDSFSTTTNILTLVMSSFENSFSITSDGRIEASSLAIELAGGNFLKLSYGLNNEFDFTHGGFVYNGDGFAGVDFSTKTINVPEPTSLACLCAALFSLICLYYRPTLREFLR